MNIQKIGKSLGVVHNVSFRVLDEVTGEVISTHIGHNSATNTLLTGIGHYLKGDGVLNQGWDMLSHYIPKYISLGTMGLISQEETSRGLPKGIGVVDYTGKVYGQISDDRLAAIGKCIDPDYAENKYGKHLEDVPVDAEISDKDATALRYIDYMVQCPGFGADGYSSSLNNGREYLGLGPIFADRGQYVSTESISLTRGDIDGDGNVTTDDLQLLLQYIGGEVSLSEKQLQAANVTYRSNHDDRVDLKDAQLLIEFFDEVLDNAKNLDQNQINRIAEEKFGTITWDERHLPTINCELISENFPRAPIAYRDIIPEVEAEFPKTLDIIFSAMISTGALAQFREPGKDYIFITEAGLWSEQTYTSGGDNGLLAGYRIAPPNRAHWDMSIDENRDRLDREILKVGKNQVVQIIWKIQLGSIDQFEGIESLYPSTQALQWLEHGRLCCTITDAKVDTETSGWELGEVAPDLEITYDGKPSSGANLQLKSDSSGSLVYTLDKQYDITGIKLRLSSTIDPLSASPDKTRIGSVRVWVSSGADDNWTQAITCYLSDNGLNVYNVVQSTEEGETLDYIILRKGVYPYIEDVKKVKLEFHNDLTDPCHIELAHVEIYALDATIIPENSTALQWNVW